MAKDEEKIKKIPEKTEEGSKNTDDSNQDNKSIKGVFSSIKEYIKQDCRFVIALFGVIITVIAVLVRFCAHKYDVGYYKHFGIDKKDILIASDSSILMIFLSVLAVLSAFILFNLLGYVFIRKRKFLMYLIISTFISFVLLFLENLIEIFKVDSLVEIFWIIILFLICFLSICILNSFAVVFLFTLSDKDKLQRKEILLSKLENKKKKNEKKTKTTRDEIGELEEIINKKTEAERTETEKISFNNKVMIGIIACIVLFVLASLGAWLLGLVDASQRTSIPIIENVLDQEITINIGTEEDPQSAKTKDGAVIYKCDDYIIVAPCYKKDKELKIYTSHQKRINIDDIEQFIIKRNYSNIEIYK